MSKKFKVVVSVLVAVIMLATSGTAVVMAQDEPEPTPQLATGDLLARVASILDITPEELADAFNQARQEMWEECQATDNRTVPRERARFREQLTEKRQEWMKKWQEMWEDYQATDNCTICQEMLNRFREQWAERQQKWVENRQEILKKYLDSAEEKGLISPDEAVEIWEWWQDRPEAVDRLLPPEPIFTSFLGRQWFAVLNKAWGEKFITQGNEYGIKERSDNRLQDWGNMRLRISPAVHGRQMIAVSK